MGVRKEHPRANTLPSPDRRDCALASESGDDARPALYACESFAKSYFCWHIEIKRDMLLRDTLLRDTLHTRKQSEAQAQVLHEPEYLMVDPRHLAKTSGTAACKTYRQAAKLTQACTMLNALNLCCYMLAFAIGPALFAPCIKKKNTQLELQLSKESKRFRSAVPAFRKS